LLYLSLPALVLVGLAMAWMAGSGDLLGMGAWAQAQFGWDLFARREATSAWHWIGGTLSCGLTFAAMGTNIGHELTHRTADRAAMTVGRWLLAITFDAEFSIEHVYGHHRRLATAADPASARRGEHFYAFLFRSLLGQTRSAAALERQRLDTLGHGFWTVHNRYLRGWLMSAVIVAAFAAAGGAGAAAVFVLAALAGRTVLEAVNYFEHYGLVREPGQPVEPRHSWNSNKRLSNAVLFNLARHSHHHAEGDAQFWQLRSFRDAPTLPYGYLTCMFLVYLVPGWYRDRMTPLLLDWDRRHASPAERRLAEAANLRSGVPALQLATQGH
jgi:Fatty acid desaturase